VAGVMRRQSDRWLGDAAAFAADDRLPLAVFPHFLVTFDLHIVSPPPVYVNGGFSAAVLSFLLPFDAQIPLY